MRHRQSVLLVGALLIGTLVSAGNAHFVGIPSITQAGEVVFVAGKVAGLGNVPQIHVVVTGFAECVNRGSNKPSADNKDEFEASGDFPVQNGRAYFSLTLLASFRPDCTPPMSVEWSGLTITVTADDGTFLTYP